VNPSSPRVTSSVVQSGASAEAIPRTPEASRLQRITGTRPTRSARGPVTSSPAMIVSVVTDSAWDDSAALTR